MPTPLYTPRVNNNDDTVRLLRVMVQPGDRVAAGDIVAEVETDKASFTVEVDREGVVLGVVPQLQDMMLGMQVGEATPPFGSLSDGVRALVLCGRDDPAPTSGPSFDQIQSQIEQERVNRRAQRYLRDLRRDAVIEYR